jgi:ribosomal protein L11 methyltransferase
VTDRFDSLRVLAPDTALAERAAAEAWAAGACGVEERADGLELVVYTPSGCTEAVHRAMGTLAGAGVEVAAPEPVPPVDWSRAWRDGLRAIEISPRLVVRPSTVDEPDGVHEASVVIDPGQAFGTGGHASTRLALILLDALPASRRRGARVLDVGCGTGVLALAALRLGARSAVALDLDPLAAEAARANARANGLGTRVETFTGSLDALAGPPFDLVLANMLRSELEPCLAPLSRALTTDGRAVLSGLLQVERDAVERGLAGAGLRVHDARTLRDDTDVWLGLVVGR